MTRGIMDTRNKWVEFMKTRMFPWKRKNLATGEWETTLVAGALRPIELWEYVHPEESLTEVFAMQHNADGSNNLTDLKELRPEIKNYALLMQKLLKLKPIPKFDKPQAFGYRATPDGQPVPVNWVPLDGFAVYPLGIKEDVKQEFPNFITPTASKGYFQEAL